MANTFSSGPNWKSSHCCFQFWMSIPNNYNDSQFFIVHRLYFVRHYLSPVSKAPINQNPVAFA